LCLADEPLQSHSCPSESRSTRPLRTSVESQSTCGHGREADGLPESRTLSGEPTRGRSRPVAAAIRHITLCAAAWAQTPHDTCTPTSSALSFDIAVSFFLLGWLFIKPPGRNFTPATLKAL